MNNVYIRRRKDKKHGIKGGLGPEIDIISTDGKKYYWIEVSVPPRPYGAGGHKGKKVAKDYMRKFSSEKERYITKNLKFKPVSKLFVYSAKFFNKKKSDEEKKFKEAMEKKGVETINFETILKEIYEKLDYRGYDETRNYLFLLKQFGYWKEYKL